MTNLQLEAIAEVYNMLSKGLTHPQKINQAYKYINPMSGMEVPQRAKILAINRFMMLSYADIQKQLKRDEEKAVEKKLEESVGTIENKELQSHSEKIDAGNDNQDIQGFLTKKEKEELKSDTAGTTLEIVTNDGKKKRTRSPNGTRKARK